MSGGYGTRIGNLTKNYPKGMLCINNKPLLEQVILNARSFGFKYFLISVFFKKEIIKKYFGDGKALGIKIKYIEEKFKMGTIGSVGLLKEKNKKNLVILNCDVLTKANIFKMLSEHIKKLNLDRI